LAIAERLRAYFDFAAHRTDFRRETLAGLTTFMTMAYIFGCVQRMGKFGG